MRLEREVSLLSEEGFKRAVDSKADWLGGAEGIGCPEYRGGFENGIAVELVEGWKSRLSSGSGDRGGGSTLWVFTVRELPGLKHEQHVWSN